MQRIAEWIISGAISLEFTLSLRTYGGWLFRFPDPRSKASAYNFTVGMMMLTCLVAVGCLGTEAPSQESRKGQQGWGSRYADPFDVEDAIIREESARSSLIPLAVGNLMRRTITC